MKKDKLTGLLFATTSFLIPFIVYCITQSSSLGFADAGEFALVTRLGSIAHPPGFPSYVFLGWLWGKVLSVFSTNHVLLMNLFSISCMSAASFFLFKSIHLIFLRFYKNRLNETTQYVVALSVALNFAFGVTVWNWSNTIEVYALHVLSMSMLIYGIILFQQEKKQSALVLAAVGCAIGLSNHHLTMILFLPFIPFLFNKQTWQVEEKITKTKSKKTVERKGSLFSFISDKEFRFFVLITIGVTAFFYLLLFLRAQSEIVFKFGSPDNLSRFMFHLSGGAWIDNTKTEVKGIASMRFPYFMNLTWEQVFLFLPLVIMGLIQLFKSGKNSLAACILVYYLLVLIYQLRIDQTADTDAYMLLPFYLLSLAIPFGIFFSDVIAKKIAYLLPIAVVVSVLIHFPKTDKRNFDLSRALMNELDKSSPKGATILISDWTLVSQYYYYRIAENFRPDLVVLNYDIKFTNHKILPLMYPVFYNQIQKEYDHFVELLGESHPQDIYNTGCHLDNPLLMQSFKEVVLKIQKRCELTGTSFLVDPKSFVWMLENNLMTTSSAVSGCFVSIKETKLNSEFIRLNQKWITHPFTLFNPAAADKLVDLEAMLDISRNYYKSLNDSALLFGADSAYNKIRVLEKEMKSNIPFLFRPKGS